MRKCAFWFFIGATFVLTLGGALSVEHWIRVQEINEAVHLKVDINDVNNVASSLRANIWDVNSSAPNLPVNINAVNTSTSPLNVKIYDANSSIYDGQLKTEIYDVNSSTPPLNVKIYDVNYFRVTTVGTWTNVAQNAVSEGTAVSLGGYTKATLFIDCALTSETAHTGTSFHIEVSPSETGDTDWYTLQPILGPIGTANSEAIMNNPLAAGSTTATVAASTTGLYDDDGVRFIYIKDGTIANSEMVLLVSHSANTSVTWLDGTANTHIQNTLMYDIARRDVVTIPKGIKRFRVNVDNTYDSDGSGVDVRTSYILER